MKSTFTIETASRIIGISLPTTANALKSAFRRRSREVHPDHSIATDATIRFQELTAAYEFAQLQRDWLLRDDGTENKPAMCVDGKTLLSDLGQGLGPTVNGKPCAPCGGKGFQSYTSEFDYEPCKDCRTSWLGLFTEIVEYRCRRCGGDGNFKRNSKAVGDCRGCNGRGWIKSKDAFHAVLGLRTVKNRCVTCKGTSKIKSNNKMLYTKCTGCKGTGEILVFNPVIPKGLLR